MTDIIATETAEERVARLNGPQLRFLLLHAFDEPHRWAWKGVDWAAEWKRQPGDRTPSRRSGRLQANSRTTQATISAADLSEIDDCWKGFPRVEPTLLSALRRARDSHGQVETA